jgi:hypothetical protein
MEIVNYRRREVERPDNALTEPQPLGNKEVGIGELKTEGSVIDNGIVTRQSNPDRLVQGSL